MSGAFGDNANSAFANLQVGSLVKVINDLNDAYLKLTNALNGVDLNAAMDTMVKLRDELVRARDKLGVMAAAQYSPVQQFSTDDTQEALVALRDAVRGINIADFTAPDLTDAVNALQLLVNNDQYASVVSNLNATKAKMQATAQMAAANTTPPQPTVRDVYGDAGGQLVIDSVNNLVNQVVKQGELLKSAALQSPGTALDAQALLNKLERLGSKNRWLSASAVDLQKLTSHNANLASNMAKQMARADVDSGTLGRLIANIDKMRRAVEHSDNALAAGEGAHGEQFAMPESLVQTLLDEMTESMQRAGEHLVQVINSERAYAHSHPMTDDEVNIALQQRALKGVKLQQPLSQTTARLLDTMYADKYGMLSAGTWQAADLALRVGATLDGATNKQAKAKAGLAGDMARLTALEVKSASATLDVARHVVADMGMVNGKERIAMAKAMRDDAVKQMRTLASIIAAQAVTVDPNDKDMVALRALHDDLRDVVGELDTAVEQNTLKNIGNTVLSGFSSTIGFISAGLAFMGMGGILDVMNYAKGGFTTDVAFGKAFYDTALTDAAFGGTFSRSAANANLARGRELFALSYGQVDPTYVMTMRNAILRGAGGRRTVGANQALADADVLAQTLSGASVMAGVDTQTITDYARNMMYDNNKPPEEVVANVFHVIDAARQAGIPIKRYFAALNGLVARTRELGLSADETTGTMEALVESGMRVEDAAELTYAAARARNNVFQGGLGNANAIVFGSMLGMNNDRPWVNMLIGMISHDANANPIKGRHALLGQMLRQRYRFLMNAVGNDDAALASLNTMLRADGFNQQQASQLTAMVRRGGVDDEQLGIVLEGMENQKERDREAVINAAEEMDRQLANASVQLGAATKVQSHRQRLMQELALLIENDLAPMFNLVTKAVDEALLTLTKIAKWALEYAGALFGDGEEANILSEGVVERATGFAGDVFDAVAEHPGAAAAGAFAGIMGTSAAARGAIDKLASSAAGKAAVGALGRNKYLALGALATGGLLALTSGRANANGAYAVDDDDNVVAVTEQRLVGAKIGGRQQASAAWYERVAQLNTEYEHLFTEEQRGSERMLVDKHTRGQRQLLDAYKQLGGDLKQIDSKQRAIISAMVTLLQRGLLTKRQAMQQLQAMANGKQTTFRVNGGKQEVELDEETINELYADADAQIRGNEPYDMAYYRMITAEYAAKKIVDHNLSEEGDETYLRRYRLIAAYYALQRGKTADDKTFTADDLDKRLTAYAEEDIRGGWTPSKVELERQLQNAREEGDTGFDTHAVYEAMKKSRLSHDQLVAMRKNELRAEMDRVITDKEMTDTLVYHRFKMKEQEAAEEKAKQQPERTYTPNQGIGAGAGAYENIPYLEWRQAIDAAANKYGISNRLIAAIAQAESGWNPNSVSQAGARGLMQVMPETAAGMGYNPDALYDPLIAIDAGARYLRSVSDQLGTTDPALIAAGYNAGPGAVQEYGGIPSYGETRAYVKNVLSYLGTGTGTLPALPHAPGALGGQTPLQQQEERGPLSERIARAASQFGGVTAKGPLIDNMWAKPTMLTDVTPIGARRTLTVGVDSHIANAAAEWKSQKQLEMSILEANDKVMRASAGMAATQVTSILQQEQANTEKDISTAAETVETTNENKDDVLHVTIASNIPADKVTVMAKRIQQELAKLQNMGSVDLDFVEKEA